MPTVDHVMTCQVEQTFRVAQVAGMFGLADHKVLLDRCTAARLQGSANDEVGINWSGDDLGDLSRSAARAS